MIIQACKESHGTTLDSILSFTTACRSRGVGRFTKTIPGVLPENAEKTIFRIIKN